MLLIFYKCFFFFFGIYWRLCNTTYERFFFYIVEFLQSHIKLIFFKNDTLRIAWILQYSSTECKWFDSWLVHIYREGLFPSIKKKRIWNFISLSYQCLLSCISYFVIFVDSHDCFFFLFHSCASGNYFRNFQQVAQLFKVLLSMIKFYFHDTFP